MRRCGTKPACAARVAALMRSFLSSGLSALGRREGVAAVGAFRAADEAGSCSAVRVDVAFAARGGRATRSVHASGVVGVACALSAHATFVELLLLSSVGLACAFGIEANQAF